MLSFKLLGQVALLKEGKPWGPFRSQKEAALLIYLAQTGQTHAREFMADLLWEERSTQQALSNLRTAIARLRKQMGNELIVERKTLALAPAIHQQVDAVALLQSLANVGPIDAAEKAHTLQSTLDTYRGHFLADFTLPDASQFDTWALATREQIHRQVITAFNKLGMYALATNDADYGIAIARRWLQVDALDEEAHTLLIRLLLKAGTVREAVAHYDACSNLLRAELGIEPPAEMTDLIRRVRAHAASTPSPTTSKRHNLPAVYDQFFGRKNVQHELHARLDEPWCRLVTIMGPGGVGKTRLATTVARSRLNGYADGVWLVELADVDPHDDDLVEAIAVEIATAIDLRLTGAATPVEQLLSHLQHKQMLLVLDNIEHLLAGVPLVLELIQRCQNVQLLVTSREALRIRAEWTVSLTGLDCPADGSSTLQSDAVDLFIVRRTQQQGTRSIDDLAAISSICRLVEGLPLAIELAAAMTHDTTCQAVADQLMDGFDALAATLRDVPRRHRSLRVVFEMSWHTLTAVQQMQLARLALCCGGFTAAAAQQIAAAHAQDLSALCIKSLLLYNAEQERYHLHAVIRAYAAAKLPEFSCPSIDLPTGSGGSAVAELVEATAAATDHTLPKHARYYLTFLAQQTAPLQKSTPQLAMAVLHPDIDNVRLAWHTALVHDPLPASSNRAEEQFLPQQELGGEQFYGELLLDALPALSIYYQLRGLAHEAEGVMQNTVTTATAWGADGYTLATRAGLERARFQNRLGRYRSAIESVATALRHAQQRGDRWAEGMGHVLWGESLWRLGEYALATAKLNDALTIANAIHSTLLIGWCHHHLGIIDDLQGRYGAAHEHLEQACAAWRTIDNAQALSSSLNSIGLICLHQGNLTAAQQAMEEALMMCNQLDNRHLQSILLNNLSMISTEQGDYHSAHHYLQSGLELATTSGNLASQGEIYSNLGKNYSLLGQPELAIETLQRVLQIAESIGNRPLLAESMIHLAEAKRQHNDLKGAEAWCRQALQIARQANLQRIECELLIIMAEIAREDNAKSAKQYCAMAIKLAEAIKHPDLLERTYSVSDHLRLAK